MSKPLQEIARFNYNIIEAPSKREGVLLTVGGISQKADTKNANGRVYPLSVWQEVLQRDDVKQRLEDRQMVGAFGHPKDGITDPEKISHVVTKQELRSNNEVYGEVDVLDTPSGRIVDSLFRAGVKVGISSRGDGSVEKKGDVDEVQKDFRLETYDFVLRPSTPGAYPGIIESAEEAQHNEELVVETIEGLVKEDTPASQRIGVLTECLKILSVLESAESHDQVKLISEQIREELGPTEPKVVLSISAREDAPPPIHTPPKENPMPNSATPGVSADHTPGLAPVPALNQLDSQALMWHQQQVQAAEAAVTATKDNEISGYKDQLIGAQREHTETKKRLIAAEELIGEFQGQVTQLEAGDNSPAYEALKQRYDAAVELLDEAIKRLPEIGELGRRTEALEGLLQSSIDKIQEEKIAESVTEHMAQVPKDLQEQVRPLLENCQNPEQVAETFRALMAVSGNGTPRRQPREPLPPQGLSEGQQPSQPKPAPAATGFAGRVGRRLAQI